MHPITEIRIAEQRRSELERRASERRLVRSLRPRRRLDLARLAPWRGVPSLPSTPAALTSRPSRNPSRGRSLDPLLAACTSLCTPPSGTTTLS